MGSDDVSLKGDAEKGRAELSIGDQMYARTFTRTDGTVTATGDPDLDDSDIANPFAFLLESNEARRAVALATTSANSSCVRSTRMPSGPRFASSKRRKVGSTTSSPNSIL